MTTLQVARLFVGNATERGIPTVLAPGESLHIDWVNATAQDPEALIVSASKSYLDWYMLTQARASTPAFTCSGDLMPGHGLFRPPPWSAIGAGKTGSELRSEAGTAQSLARIIC